MKKNLLRSMILDVFFENVWPEFRSHNYPSPMVEDKVGGGRGRSMTFHHGEGVGVDGKEGCVCFSIHYFLPGGRSYVHTYTCITD